MRSFRPGTKYGSPTPSQVETGGVYGVRRSCFDKAKGVSLFADGARVVTMTRPTVKRLLKRERLVKSDPAMHQEESLGLMFGVKFGL